MGRNNALVKEARYDGNTWSECFENGTEHSSPWKMTGDKRNTDVV